MTSSLLPGAIIALATFHALRLLEEGMLFEAILLAAFGIALGISVEALINMNRCHQCGSQTKKATNGLYYCEECRRYWEKPRRA